MQTYNKADPESVQKMFGQVASSYDKTNLFLSMGLCQLWNRKLANSVGDKKMLLDLCAGTGAIAFQYLKTHPRADALLIDFCDEMLEISKERGKAYQGRFTTQQADVHKLDLEDGEIEAATMAYGIRNLKDPQKAIHEVYRVLKAGATFSILELTRPNLSILRMGHKVYLKTVVPMLGNLLAKDKQAYRYLARTIESFLAPEVLVNMVEQAGFSQIKQIPLSGGIATLLVAKK